MNLRNLDRKDWFMLIGFLLIIVAVVLYAVSFSMGSENVEEVKMKPGEEKVEEIHVPANGNYTLILSFRGNASYQLYAENGTVLKSGSNDSYVEVNITTGGTYRLHMKNVGQGDATAAILLVENQRLLNGLYTVYLSSIMCCTGSTMVIIAFFLLLIKRRREEKIYSS